MIYADYNSSSYPHPKVIEYMKNRLEMNLFANPNAIHSMGQKIMKAVEAARTVCAEVLGCQRNQIVFNSGASEGISHVFHSFLYGKKDSQTIVSSKIEHSAVKANLELAEENGHKIIFVNTKINGEIDISHFNQIMEQNTVNFVTIMAANNETGVIQPIQAIADLCHEKNIPFFSDTTQYIGKNDFSFKNSKMDYAVLSSHKIGSLIGAGILIVKDPASMKCFIHGGGQESGLRGGTQNYLGIEAMGYALKLFDESKSTLKDLREMKTNFEKNIKKIFKDFIVIGAEAPRLAGTSLVGFKGLHGQVVQIELESRDIFVSTSSACSDNEPMTSKILTAMGIDDQIGRSVTRLSFSSSTKQVDFDHLQKSLIEVYNKLARVKY